MALFQVLFLALGANVATMVTPDDLQKRNLDIFLLTDQVKEHQNGARMLSMILKYHGWSESVQVKSIAGAAGELNVQNAIDVKGEVPAAVVSFVSNQITRRSLLALSMKLNFWVIHIAEEAAITINSKSGGLTKHVVLNTPWTTMLNALPPILAEERLKNLTIAYDEEYELLIKHLPAEVRRGISVQSVMLGSATEQQKLDSPCSRGSLDNHVMIMANSTTAEQLLRNLSNCSRAFNKYVFTKDQLAPSSINFDSDVLWIRPHFTEAPSSVDSIISWSSTAGLRDELFTIGRELEIAFYDNVADLLNQLTEGIGENDSLAEVAFRCLVEVQNRSNLENDTNCNGTRLFGAYRKTSSGAFHQDVSLKLYRIVCNERHREAFLVADWTMSSGLAKIYKVGLSRKIFSCRHYRVVTYVRAPFVYRKDSEDGTKIYYGYCIDILKALSKALSFTYEIYEVRDGEYGVQNAIGRMNGMAAELFRGDANIALASFVPTPEREALVDFTCPFHEATGLGALLKDHARESTVALLTIATWDAWLAVLIAFLITSLLISVFDHLSPFSGRNNHERYGHGENPLHIFTFAESAWFCLTSCSLQGAKQLPMNLSGRIVATGWWLFCFLFLAFYSASIAALLSFRNEAKLITQFEQLFQQNGIKYSVVEDSAAGYYFSRLAELENLMDQQWKASMRRSSLDLEEKVMLGFWDYPFEISYRQLWKLMRDVGMPKNISEAVSRVLASPSPTQGFAFIATEPTVEFLNTLDCQVRMVKSDIFARYYAIGVQQGSELGPLLSKQILLMRTDGEIDRMKKKWWNETEKGPCVYLEPKSEEVDMYDIRSLFFIVLLGILLSILQLTLKRLIPKARKTNRIRDQAVAATVQSKRFSMWSTLPDDDWFE